MRSLLNKILNADEKFVGINRRNLEYVYPYNSRKHFPLANDKVLAKGILEKNNIPVPATYALVTEIWEIDIKLEQLNSQHEIVIKPAHGSGGGGILILFKKDNGEWFNHAGAHYNRSKIKYHLASILYGVYSNGDKDKAIIEYCITPHSFLTSIYSKGVPDFRIIFLQDMPLMAMLRIPTDKSDGKANLHQGAMGIGINMSEGILTQGYFKNKYVDAHPDTGFYFSGKKIPQWQKTMEIAQKVAQLIPLKYLGIDIILDEKKGPMVIEINARPGLQIQNINKTGINIIINENKKNLLW